MNKTNVIIFIIFIVTFLLGTSHMIFKIMRGEKTGFHEFLFFSTLLILLLPSTTSKGENDEEKKREAFEKSAKISYFLLLSLLLVAVIVDEMLTGEINTLLAIVLTIGMATLPVIEFLMMKKSRS